MLEQTIDRIDTLLSVINLHPEYSHKVRKHADRAVWIEANKHSLRLETENKYIGPECNCHSLNCSFSISKMQTLGLLRAHALHYCCLTAVSEHFWAAKRQSGLTTLDNLSFLAASSLHFGMNRRGIEGLIPCIW